MLPRDGIDQKTGQNFDWSFFKQNDTKRWGEIHFFWISKLWDGRFLYGQLFFPDDFPDILIPSIPKDQWKWNPKILEIFGICHWYPFLLNFSTFWPARMTIELFKGDVSGGEAGTSFPRMVLLFLSGTIITSNGHILDRHFRKKKKIKKAIANFDSSQLESCTS